jgi:uncharacterized protein (DUF488 family)
MFFTIGYEQATQAAVIEAMRSAGVELLVDVRAVAASRRAGFSKTILAASAAEAGIGYLHLRGLGTPADGRAAARAGRHGEMQRIFAAHLAGDEAQHDLAALLGLAAQGRRFCLLCFEHRPEHCHRRLVAEEVTARTGALATDLLPAL